MRIKYPRTLHHPSSPGVQSDDKIAPDLSAFEGAEVVVTEKMDGENISLYTDGFHARSLDTGYHQSRDWLAAFQAQVGYMIPAGWRFCGEYLYARHALPYNALGSYFLSFSVWDDTNTCISWDATIVELNRVGIASVPVVYRGRYCEDLIPDLATKLDTDRSEGLILRLSNAFSFDAFSRSVVKWVRAGHVQSDKHWRSGPIVPNKLKGAAS